jgi:catechol 2,3-dioxygenase-like lactoylglutathione lyase family enzyme
VEIMGMEQARDWVLLDMDHLLPCTWVSFYGHDDHGKWWTPLHITRRGPGALPVARWSPVDDLIGHDPDGPHVRRRPVGQVLPLLVLLGEILQRAVGYLGCLQQRDR